MHYDAQIQMIVSTFKLSQTLDVDPETGKASMRYQLKCNGGARSSSFSETQAVVSIREVSRADSAAMQVLSAEYKMVKQLSDNPDLISRS